MISFTAAQESSVRHLSEAECRVFPRYLAISGSFSPRWPAREGLPTRSVSAEDMEREIRAQSRNDDRLRSGKRTTYRSRTAARRCLACSDRRRCLKQTAPSPPNAQRSGLCREPVEITVLAPSTYVLHASAAKRAHEVRSLHCQERSREPVPRRHKRRRESHGSRVYSRQA